MKDEEAAMLVVGGAVIVGLGVAAFWLFQCQGCDKVSSWTSGGKRWFYHVDHPAESEHYVALAAGPDHWWLQWKTGETYATQTPQFDEIPARLILLWPDGGIQYDNGVLIWTCLKNICVG